MRTAAHLHWINNQEIISAYKCSRIWRRYFCKCRKKRERTFKTNLSNLSNVSNQPPPTVSFHFKLGENSNSSLIYLKNSLRAHFHFLLELRFHRFSRIAEIQRRDTKLSKNTTAQFQLPFLRSRKSNPMGLTSFFPTKFRETIAPRSTGRPLKPYIFKKFVTTFNSSGTRSNTPERAARFSQ